MPRRKTDSGPARRSGIEILGSVPWGTHFCQFYDTARDLVDILVPYFQAGLADNEFCMWVTSEPLGVAQATAALRAAVPDLDRRIADGQIEILDYRDWYTRSGRFDAEEVLQGWVQKLEGALERGYAGLRLTGNTFWLEPAVWDDFTSYEEKVNSVIGRYRMLAVCTYSLRKCGGAEIADVISNHEFSLIKRAGRWQIIESSHHRLTEAALRESERRFRSLYSAMDEGVVLHELVYGDDSRACDYTLLEVNPAFERITGIPRDKAVGARASALYGIGEAPYLGVYARVAETGKPESFETQFAPMEKVFRISAFSPSQGQFATVFEDITERHLAQQELERTRSMLGEAQKIAHLGSFEYIAATRTTVWSEEEYRIYGLDPAQPSPAYDEMLARCIHPDDASLLHETFTRAMATSSVYELEHRIVRPDGSVRWVYNRAQPYFDEHGGLLRYVGATLDVTERKQAEEALRRSEERLRLAQVSAGAGTWDWDIVTGKLEWSPELFGLFGLDPGPEEASFDSWRAALHPEDRQLAEERIRTAVDTRAPLASEYRIVLPSGEVRWINALGHATYDESGAPQRMSGICVDITDRKQAEEALHESEERFRTVADFTYDMEYWVGPDGRMLYVSPSCERLTGYTSEEIVSDPGLIKSMVHPDDRPVMWTHFDAEATKPETDSLEYRVLTRQGEVRWIAHKCHPVTAPDGGFRGRRASNRDITERRRTERALRESEERLKRAQAIAHLGSWELDVDDDQLTWSDEVYRIFGLQPREFAATYEAFLDHVHPDDRAAVDAAYRGSIRDGKDTYEIEHRVVRASTGEVRWVHERCEHIRDESGNIARSIGMVQDITERRAADLTIAALARFPSENPNPVMRIGARGTLLHANDASDCFLRIWEVEPGMTVPEEWCERVRDALSGGTPGTVEAECDGRVYSVTVVPVAEAAYVPLHGTSLADPRAEAGYVNLYATDITERKRGEAELHEAHASLETRVQERTAELTAAYDRIKRNEQQYRLLAENVTDVIWTTDLELRFQFISPSSRILSGRSPEEIHSMNLQEMLTPESFAAAMASVGEKIALEKGGPSTSARRPWTIDLEIVCADGSTVWTETTVTILRDGGGNPVGLLGVTRDIEDRRRLEAQLMQAQKLEAIGRLAGGVAHDFNNMMQVVTGYSTRVLKAISGNDPQREHIEEIQKAGKRAATLTQQLLAFGRRQTLQPRVLDLNTVVMSMERMLRSVLGEDVTLVTKLAPDAWQVEADPVRMEQVVMNLSVNARDAMPAGGTLTIETSNVVLGEYHGHYPAVPPGSYVMLAVSDTGCGMDEETRERLFEPFFTTKAAGQGTGLGLATVYGTVEQSGGAIRVYTAPGQGTTFKVYLPRVTTGEEADATAAPAGSSPGGCETVLVVEDEDSVRQLTVLELEELGYRVLQAQNPDEALERSRGHNGPIHLLLSDVVLPGGSGPEVYERLAVERPDMRVLFMSGHAEKRIVHHGVVDPGVAFIEKPFTAEQLATKVREVMVQPPAAPRGGH